MIWDCLMIIAMMVVPVVAYFKKALSLAASILAALMIAFALSVKVNYAAFLVASFILISILDYMCHRKMQSVDKDITSKVGTRDAIQILVNGGISMVCVSFYHITNEKCFLLGSVSSLIESFGDSAASDIGISLKQQAFDICRFRKVTTGLSGGVSFGGTLGCLGSCILLSCLAYVLQIANNAFEVLMLIVASFLGCIVDSILGSLIQRKNRCSVCNKITEKNIHCNNETTFYSGIRFINNDVVNLLSNTFSAILILILIG